MGKLIYGPWGAEFVTEDRTLDHLRVVILAKLRRNEAFPFSWDIPHSEGSGRDLIWLHPAIALQFKFNGNGHPPLNRDWVDALMLAANEPLGLRVVPEPHSPTR